MSHSGESDLYDEREKAVIAYARELTRDATVSEETFEELRRHFPSEPDIVEIHMAAVLPNLTNRVNNPFEIELEEDMEPAST